MSTIGKNQARKTRPFFGPGRVNEIPVTSFNKLTTHEQLKALEELWKVISPTVLKNLDHVPLWKTIATVYLEGLIQGIDLATPQENPQQENPQQEKTPGEEGTTVMERLQAKAQERIGYSLSSHETEYETALVEVTLDEGKRRLLQALPYPDALTALYVLDCLADTLVKTPPDAPPAPPAPSHR